MARLLNEKNVVRLGGTNSAPTTCDCDYDIKAGGTDLDNSDLQGVRQTHNEPTPNFNQTAAALCVEVTDAVKTVESV